MKRLKRPLTLALCLLMVLSLAAACRENGSETPPPSGATETKNNSGIIDPGSAVSVPKNTDGTEAPVEETIVNTGGVFFRPDNGGTGDVTPIYHDGQYYLFFLHSTNFKWCYVTTTDFVHYSDVTVLRDFGGTGDVLCVDGTWHLFASKVEEGQEVIHHYEGKEITALRDSYQNITSDGEQFGMSAWRDPRVWYDETIGKYRMLVTTSRIDSDGVSRNGCIAYLTSDDLYTWEIGGPYFASGYYSGACECPDHFQMGEWYYLVYSDCSYGKRTYYAKSQSPNGPWEIPDNDTFDSLLFYAAKTVSDGTDRYAIGWAGDRSAFTLPLNADGSMIDPDFATVRYAGNMVVHKLVQLENGDLSVEPVDEVVNSFTREVRNVLQPLCGNWTTGEDSAAVKEEEGYAALLMQELPGSFVLTFRLKTDAKQSGIALNVNGSFADRGYYFAFERQYARIRQISGVLSGVAGYYFPYESELERPLRFESGKSYDVTVIRDGQIAVIYVDGQCALTTRMTTTNGLALGLFCYAGSAEFSDIRMMK